MYDRWSHGSSVGNVSNIHIINTSKNQEPVQEKITNNLATSNQEYFKGLQLDMFFLLTEYNLNICHPQKFVEVFSCLAQ